ncbi:MAG: hypothetical protein ACI9UA_004840 [Pseudoalteromonas tetraodonis]|jgi:uncharacterized protein YbbC (DUF1343 family)
MGQEDIALAQVALAFFYLMFCRRFWISIFSFACWLPLLDAEDLVAGFDGRKLEAMDAEIRRAIARKRLPGGVLWFERGASTYKKAFGNRSVYPAKEAMTLDTVFDAASLTKVVATTPSILKLIEMKKLRLDDRVQGIIPELAGDPNKADITVRHLLTHTSGLPAGVKLGFEWGGYSNGLAQACAELSVGDAGFAYRYSDLNFILLGEIVWRVSGQRLDVFAKQHVFVPLKMNDTQFLPPGSLGTRIAPTTRMPDKSVLRGVVHDPTSRAMGGVTGHAGLFTTASDLARYARMWLNDGVLDGVRILKKETLALATGVRSPALITARRGLGWDIDSPYAGPRGEHFPRGSFGHTGWTGTSLWIDPFSNSFLILLSNRNHPTEAGGVVSLRYRLATLAAEAIEGLNFSNVSGQLAPLPGGAKAALDAAVEARRGQVLNGIDVLAASGFAALKGKKVGLITNHTGRTRDARTSIDLLHQSKEVSLVCLFGPEHGIRGTADESVKDGVDKHTRLPIRSLFANGTFKPTPEQLAGVDTLVFDIQDIGCRFYTYISTMGLCMEAAEAAGIGFVVLDRVNPIGGHVVDGPLRDGKQSFTAFHDIPLRHGMTVGELAKMFRAERYPKLQLEVVEVQGWKRSMFFDQTGLPWKNPSPNIRNLNQAILYPGVGLLEFTNLSVGRGTTAPFELVGAPFIDPDALARELRAAELPGLGFVPVRFTPTSSVHRGKVCGGVRILVTDRERCAPVDLGLTLGQALARLYKDAWETKNLNTLLVSAPTVDAILGSRPVAEIRSDWQPALEKFAERRERYLIYK